MASNNQNEQEKLQKISEDELNDVTGGTPPLHWTDDQGHVHGGGRPDGSKPIL